MSTISQNPSKITGEFVGFCVRVHSCKQKLVLTLPALVVSRPDLSLQV